MRRKLLKKPPNDRERKCIATGETGSPNELIRFVLDPDGVVTPDFSGQLPGRGAWVTASRDALRIALKKSAFARSFKQAVVASDGLEASIATGLAKSALNALGLARRVGDAAVGFDQAAKLLRAKKTAALISAVDGAADGKRKLQALASGVDVYECFGSRDLSAALGRDGIVHVALEKGAAANRFIREARRFERFGLEPRAD